MIWDELLADVFVPMWEGDAELVAALGGLWIFMANASRPVRVPSVEWLVSGDRFTEVFNPIDLQLDYWATNPAQGFTIERRLRALTHRETRRRLGEYDLATLYEDSFTHEYPKPGVIHRSLRFLIEPVRRRWATGVTS